MFVSIFMENLMRLLPYHGFKKFHHITDRVKDMA